MISREQVQISDCTLPEAENKFELSFREKIELCRIIDKMGVSSINLCPIRQKKIDRLLIKSIVSAVTQASIAVPVVMTDAESVDITWDALKEAKKPVLQVTCPVSSVQMEYLMHMKPNAVLDLAEKTIVSCREKTENIEFVAQDATRCDPVFLVKIIQKAIAAGVGKVTLCDTAGMMMPEEISAWFTRLYQDIPSLEQVVTGFYSSSDMNLADAGAISAIRSGVREIKGVVYGDRAISLPNIVRILDVKGGSIGVSTGIGTEQLHRIATQVAMICHPAGVKSAVAQSEGSQEAEIFLNVHDSMETVIRAAESLGYDLNAEDQQKVWNSFCQTAAKKDTVTLKELEAIIAAEAMQVPPAYHDVRYVINTGNQTGAMALMKLKYHSQDISGIAAGDGAIDAAFNSIEQATGRHFELEDFQIQSVTQGREAMGETIVKLRWEGKLYSGRGISTDIVGAGIMAYINAVNKIVYEEEDA